MVFFWLLWKPLAIDKRAVSENLLSISKGELDASGNSCIVCKKGDVIPPFPPPPKKKKFRAQLVPIFGVEPQLGSTQIYRVFHANLDQ